MIGPRGITWNQKQTISHFVNKTCSSLKWKVKIADFRVTVGTPFYYRPPEGGRLYDMKVASGYAFLRTYYV